MARFGTWAPLASNWASQQRMAQVDILSIHTMVGSLAGTDAMFRRNTFAGTFSHFGVGGNGECTQWQDTAYRGAANYNGNWHIISVECADLGPQFPAWNTNDGSAVPAFTDAQCETLAQLIATMCKAHDIPCVLIPDAKPGRRGIGYHRLGVPGYMVPGAEQWSTATGKVCPGNRRIAQIPGIIARAQAIMAGAPAQEDDMSYSDWPKADRDRLLQEIRDYAISPMLGAIADSTWLYSINGTNARDRLQGTDAAANAAAAGVRTAADPALIAASVVGQLGTGLAREVVAEMGKQLGGAA